MYTLCSSSFKVLLHICEINYIACTDPDQVSIPLPGLTRTRYGQYKDMEDGFESRMEAVLERRETLEDICKQIAKTTYQTRIALNIK